jgi:hypothetical protein
MPLDASDRIRRIQQTTLFQGYAIQKQTTQPGVNVSSCTGFQFSTLHQFQTFDYGYKIEEGRVYFSTCQGVQ